jgi:hypothetical protein
MRKLSSYFLLALTLSLLLTACGNNSKDQNYKPLLIDEARILKQETINWLTTYSYPKGFAFVIRTIKNLPQREVGSAVDDSFEEDAKKCPDPKACTQRGVYIVVSQSPALIQVRVGSELVAQSRWAGITSGPKYIEKQLPATSGDFDKAVHDMVEWLSPALPQATDISWIKRWTLLDLTQNLHSELDDLSLPSDGFYGNYVLKPFLHARILEQRFFGTWWITYLIASAFFLAVGFAIESTVNLAIGKTSPPVANGMNLVIAILFGLFLALPSAGSAILLSGSRLEDQIALRSSGIPGAESFTFSTESFVVETGILLALLLLLLRVAKGMAKSAEFVAYASLSRENQQRLFSVIREKNPTQAWLIKTLVTGDSDAIGSSSEEDFEDEPFGSVAAKNLIDSLKAGIRWGLLAWLFLPKALTIVAMCLWIVPIIKGGFSYIITSKRVSAIT